MVRIQIYLEGDGGGAQSCPTLCGPMDCSPPGFSIHGISQQEYWNGLPFPTPGGHPNQGIEPTFLASPAFADRVFTTEPSRKPHIYIYGCICVYICMHIYVYVHIIFFFISFHYDLSQAVEYGPLCSTVGPCCLSIFSIYGSLHLLIPDSQSLSLSASPS